MDAHAIVRCFTKDGKPTPCPKNLPSYDEIRKPKPRLVPSTASDHEKQGLISGCCDSALNPPITT